MGIMAMMLSRLIEHISGMMAYGLQPVEEIASVWVDDEE